MLCILCGVIYERVLRDWLIATTRRRELATVFLLCWLSLHLISFRLFDWRVQTSWEHYAGKIHEAEAQSQQTGKMQFVHVKTRVTDFDFDLLIKAVPAKDGHAPDARN